jgi:hypothetical protein
MKEKHENNYITFKFSYNTHSAKIRNSTSQSNDVASLDLDSPNCKTITGIVIMLLDLIMQKHYKNPNFREPRLPIIKPPFTA